MAKPFINFDGKILNEDDNLVSANNRSFRYGDGFFETLRINNSKIEHFELHSLRIKKSTDLLKFELPTHLSIDKILNQAIELSHKNNHAKLGRIRINFFRGDGGLFDAENHFLHYVIQTWALETSMLQLNENGLVIDVYPHAQKSMDAFSNIKSNNYLQYTMAALWAKENKLNDTLILNSNQCIADSTIANIFIVKNGEIQTPSLNQGCVAGITRQALIEKFQQQKIPFQETAMTIADVLQADEVFLTNAIKKIMWVKQAGNCFYNNNVIAKQCFEFLKN